MIKCHIAKSVLLNTALLLLFSSLSGASGLVDGQPKPGPGATLIDRLIDGSSGPQMVVVPAGDFTMGNAQRSRERPVHQVRIPRSIAVGRYEVSVAEFAAFAAATDYQPESGCWYHTRKQQWLLAEDANWRSPGYAQTQRFPVTCIIWREAVAYAQWLSTVTGQRYRLPSEAEFEYFSRAGGENSEINLRGEDSAPCKWLNGASSETGLGYAYACSDGYEHASPNGSFPANDFGLHDTRGNLWEFTADCWNESYGRSWRSLFFGPPLDGSPWQRGYCGLRVIRGGSYLSSLDNLRVTAREHGSGLERSNRVGFRLVREL